MNKDKLLVRTLTGLLVLSLFPVLVSGESPVQLRLMKERAEIVTKRKNLYIERVLNSYTIPYRKNEDGVVFMIEVGGRWYEVERIEIIPQMDISGVPIKGAGYEIYFLTKDGQSLLLGSDIQVR